MPERRLASIDQSFNRYQFGNSRTIHNTGQLTATMIKTEWKLTGTFRLSADGAALIKKSPNVQIKYSNFRGQSAVTGELGPINGICKSGISSAGNWRAIGECSASEGQNTQCSPYSGAASVPRMTLAATSTGSRWSGSPSTYPNGSMYTGAKCAQMGTGIELAPGRWRLTYDYSVGCSSSPDKYNKRKTRIGADVYLGSSKTNVGSRAKQVSHEVQSTCTPPYDMPPCTFGRAQANNATADFNVSEGSQWVSFHFHTTTSDYSGSSDNIVVKNLTKIG